MKNISGTMKGVYLTGHGGQEKLEYRNDIPIPKPAPNNVLVRVAAAGIIIPISIFVRPGTPKIMNYPKMLVGQERLFPFRAYKVLTFAGGFSQ